MRLKTWTHPGNRPQPPSRRMPRPVISHDDSGSMLLALFAIIILTSLVSVVLMATIAQQAKTRKGTDFTFAGEAADAAVNDAMLMANANATSPATATVTYYSIGNRRDGMNGEFMWSWTATAGPPGPSNTWEITALGCRKTTAPPCPSTAPRRTVTATLTGAPVVKNTSSNGEVAYVLDPNRGFGRALFADVDLNLQGPTTVGSYGSTVSYGQVGTNGLATFGPSVFLDGIYMSNTQNRSSADRCSSPSLCPSTSQKVHDIRPKLEMSSTLYIDKGIADNTPPYGAGTCPAQLAPWVASTAPGSQIPAGLHCYSSMTFDHSVTVATNTKVFVAGPITVASGMQINAPNTTPQSTLLQIFSSGSDVNIQASGSSQTSLGWNLWAPGATCTTSAASTAMVNLSGSTVCQKILTQGPLHAQWDYALAATPAGLAGLAVWETTGYHE